MLIFSCPILPFDPPALGCLTVVKILLLHLQCSTKQFEFLTVPNLFNSLPTVQALPSLASCLVNPHSPGSGSDRSTQTVTLTRLCSARLYLYLST
jgi:hypothetical protein